ncbi:hypothetical protein ABEB36_002650 [Hypothenemus hampei]
MWPSHKSRSVVPLPRQLDPLSERLIREMLEELFDRKLKISVLKNLYDPPKKLSLFSIGVQLCVAEAIPETSGKVTMKVFAKFFSTTDEFAAITCLTQVQFLREYEFYVRAVPAILEYQDHFNDEPPITKILPFFFGGKLSDNKNAVWPDDTGIILLKYITPVHYKKHEDYPGITASIAERALRTLARFHGLFLALRLKYPLKFQSKVSPCLIRFKRNDDVPNFDDIMDHVDLCLQNSQPKLTSAQCEAFKFAIKISQLSFWTKRKANPDWFTVCHSNCWVGSFRFKDAMMDKNVKIKNFENVEYNSLCTDVAFFLLTSLNATALKDNYKSLTQFYFEQLSKTMAHLGVHQKKIYNLQNFMAELQMQGPKALINAIITSSYMCRENFDALGQPELGEKFRRKLMTMIEFMFRESWITAPIPII